MCSCCCVLSGEATHEMDALLKAATQSAGIRPVAACSASHSSTPPQGAEPEPEPTGGLPSSADHPQIGGSPAGQSAPQTPAVPSDLGTPLLKQSLLCAGDGQAGHVPAGSGATSCRQSKMLRPHEGTAAEGQRHLLNFFFQDQWHACFLSAVAGYVLELCF